MKYIVKILLYSLPIVCFQANSQVLKEEGILKNCIENFNFTSVIKAIILEEQQGAPLFQKLQNAGFDSIKIATNLQYQTRKIIINNRTAYFIPDTNIRLPRIVLAIGKNCKYGKFEFGTNRFAIKGSIEIKDKIWKTYVEEIIEIN